MKIKKYLLTPILASLLLAVVSCDSEGNDSDVSSATEEDTSGELGDGPIPGSILAGDFLTITDEASGDVYYMDIHSGTELEMVGGSKQLFAVADFAYDKEEDAASIIARVDNEDFNGFFQDADTYTPAEFSGLISDDVNLIAAALNSIYEDYSFDVGVDGDLFVLDAFSVDFNQTAGSFFALSGRIVKYEFYDYGTSDSTIDSTIIYWDIELTDDSTIRFFEASVDIVR